MTYNQTIDDYQTCSKKCSNINPNRIQKIKQTCLKKYGAISPLSNSSSVKYKVNQYWKDLGVENPGQLEEIKDKIKKTNVEKYGNEAYLKSDEFHRRRKETCLKHFGVEHQFMSKEIQEKVKTTLIERYGVENAYQIEKCKEAQRATKYSQSFKTLDKYKDFVIPLFDESEWEGTLKGKKYKWKCVKCGNEFAQKIYTTHFNEEGNMPRCLKCFPKINGFSYKELELLDFCKQYFPDAAKNKQLIKPLEVDICIPELKLAIEFNGIYFHCIQNTVQGQHMRKTILCNEKGYRLIHIWEDEWDKYKEKIKERLKEVFEGREDLKFTEREIILDRAWFNNIEISGYALKEELLPEIVKRDEFDVENCGYLRYERV